MVYIPANIYLLPINIHRLNRDDSKNRSDFAVVAVAVYLVYYHHRTYRTVCSVRHRDLVAAAVVVDHPVVVGVVVRDVAAGDHHVVVAAAAAVVDSHHLVAPRVDTAYLSEFAAGVAVADRTVVVVAVAVDHYPHPVQREGEECHQEEPCHRAVVPAAAGHYYHTEKEADGIVAVAVRTVAEVLSAVADFLVVPVVTVPLSPLAAAVAADRTEETAATAVARTGRIVAAVVLRTDPTSKTTLVAGRANTRRDYSDRDSPRHLQTDHRPMISRFPRNLVFKRISIRKKRKPKSRQRV